jgi:hypothetical protein
MESQRLVEEWLQLSFISWLSNIMQRMKQEGKLEVMW